MVPRGFYLLIGVALSACGARDALPIDAQESTGVGGGATVTSTSGTGASGGCSGDLDSDPDHCGRCNHSCLGGACVSGQCQPFDLWIGSVSDIELDATHVYWTENAELGTVRRIDKNGGEAQVLADAQPAPFALAVDDTHVYWTNNLGGLARGSKTTPGPSQLFAAAGPGNIPYAIALDEENVWWTTSFEGALLSTNKSDGATIVWFTGTSAVHAVATDTDSVFFMTARDGELYRLDKSVGQFEPATTAPPGFGWIAMDDAYIYGAPTAQRAVITAVPKRGPALPATISSSVGMVHSLAVDDERVYWTSMGESGTVYAAPKGGASAQVLAANEFFPGFIEVDDTAIYWSGAESLRKLAK